MNHRGHRGKPERENVGEQRAKSKQQREITTVNRDVLVLRLTLPFSCVFFSVTSVVKFLRDETSSRILHTPERPRSGTRSARQKTRRSKQKWTARRRHYCRNGGVSGT